MSTYVLNTNVASLVAQRHLSTMTRTVQSTYERVASGFKIIRAADNAAGLTISENLRGDMRAIKMALQNSQDGISVLQVTEGTLNVISDNLQRIRELAVQAASDNYADAQRDAIEQEIKARLADNQRIVQAAQFNGTNLLTGAMASARVQIGPDGASFQNSFDIVSAFASTSASALGILGSTTSTGWTTLGSIDITDGDKARQFLNDLDAAITRVSGRRTLIGGFQNRLSAAIDNLEQLNQNLAQSESRIRDADLANETSILTKNQMLQQAAMSILMQANNTPSSVLKLLQ